MKCPYCGCENPDTSRFCVRCGIGLGAPKMQPQGSRPEGQAGQQGSGQQGNGQNAGWNGQGQQGGQNAGWNGQGRQGGGQNYGWSGQGQQRPGQDYGRNPGQNAGRGSAGNSGKPGRSREEKKIIVMGVILACIVLVAGVGAYFAVTHFMKSDSSGDKSSAQAVTTLTPTPSVSESGSQGSSSKTTTPTPTPTATPTEKAEKVTASLLSDSDARPSGYSKLTVKDAKASSNVVQEGYDNSVKMLLDGDETSSWQEGAAGDGIGEYVRLNLGSEKEVRYITLKLGNWRDMDRYQMNNRPKQLTIWLDDESYTLTFPDEKKEFCVILSDECQVSTIQIYIDSVYKGTEWDDTCISEVGIYGK